MTEPVSDGSKRHFRIDGLIGKGAYGEVYSAEQVSSSGFRRRVALKQLNESLTANIKAAERMRDEARILGRLSHRNIVTVFDLVRIQRRWVVVMDYVAGADLHQVSRTLRDLDILFPPAAAFEIGASICDALNAAWGADNGTGGTLNLVHRDIKPSNIRLTPDGDVKVLDFGVARANMDSREAVTRGPELIGTERYMAPERLLNEINGAPGDVYATAATVLEMLNQEPLGRSPILKERHQPFVATSVERMVEKITAPPGVLKEVEALFNRALHFDPTQRPTAMEFSTALWRLSRQVDGEPAVAFAREHMSKVTDTIKFESREFSLHEESSGASEATWGGAGTGVVPPASASDGSTQSEITANTSWWGLGPSFIMIGFFLFIVLGGLTMLLWWMHFLDEKEPAIEITEDVESAAPPAVDAVEPTPEVEITPTPEVEITPTPDGETTPTQPSHKQQTSKSRTRATTSKPAKASEPEGSAVSAVQVSRALFVMTSATSLRVTCGDVKAVGTTQADIRDFPAGNCLVSATLLEGQFKAEVSVMKKRTVTCRYETEFTCD